MTSENRTVRLRDGRLLGYAEYGDPAGRPVFYFHGFPGSRLEAQLSHAMAEERGVRVIAVDRPGYGLSDFKPGRTIGQWPEDVVALADALGLERFAVIGVSGGGPYAAACALKIPERVTGVAVVSGSPPPDWPRPEGVPRLFEGDRLFVLGRWLFPLARLAMWWSALRVRRDPGAILTMLLRSPSVPQADKRILNRPEAREMMKRDILEAFRQGGRGAAWEGILIFARPWDFSLRDIGMEVRLWHGEEDANVPVSAGRYVASVLPNCRATFLPGEGHYMVVDRMQEIWDGLGR